LDLFARMQTDINSLYAVQAEDRTNVT